MASPGFQVIQALADARKLADGREIGRVERHALENGPEGVLAADHHLDGGGDARLLRAGGALGGSRDGREGGGAIARVGYTRGAAALALTGGLSLAACHKMRAALAAAA